MPDDSRAITTKGLRKRYGYRLALKDVDLEVSPGETVAILGRNGAGKSTLIRILAGIAAPTSGVVRVFGEDPRRPWVRRRLGIVAHQTFLVGGLTVEENLLTWLRLQGIPDPGGVAVPWLDRVGLLDRRRQRTGTLSRGQAQRLTLARALAPDPDLLLLDEPFTGLDIQAAALLEEVVREGERTIVMVTHDVEAARRLAGRVCLLKGGRHVYAADAAGIGAGEIEERF
jgi:ABC-type multidrug transport system ATPase subunit